MDGSIAASEGVVNMDIPGVEHIFFKSKIYVLYNIHYSELMTSVLHLTIQDGTVGAPPCNPLFSHSTEGGRLNGSCVLLTKGSC